MSFDLNKSYENNVTLNCSFYDSVEVNKYARIVFKKAHFNIGKFKPEIEYV